MIKKSVSPAQQFPKKLKKKTKQTRIKENAV